MIAGLDRLKGIPRAALPTARRPGDARPVALVFCSLIATGLGLPAGPWLFLALALALRASGWGVCRHEHATHRRDIHGDEINARGGMRSEWVCDECDAAFTRPGLVGPERDPVALVFEQLETIALEGVAAERDELRRQMEELRSEREFFAGRFRAMKDEAYAAQQELKGLRELYDRTRANLAALCGSCSVIEVASGARTFQCTGRGRLCSSSLEHFQQAAERADQYEGYDLRL
jgi:hypothetical protein